MITLHISGAEGKFGEERDNPQVIQSTCAPQQAFSILCEVTRLWGQFFSGLEAVAGRIGQSLKQEKATRGNLLCGASDLENMCEFLLNQNRQASVSTRINRHEVKSA